MSKLTRQQETFVNKYLAYGFDREKAALESGYSQTSWPSIISRLLQKPQVKHKIDQFFASQVEKTSVESGEVVQQLRRIAFAPVSDRVTNSDRLKACELLAKILGLTRDGLAVGVDVSVNQTIDQNEESEIRKLAVLNNLRLSGVTSPTLPESGQNR